MSPNTREYIGLRGWKSCWRWDKTYKEHKEMQNHECQQKLQMREIIPKELPTTSSKKEF